MQTNNSNFGRLPVAHVKVQVQGNKTPQLGFHPPAAWNTQASSQRSPHLINPKETRVLGWLPLPFSFSHRTPQILKDPRWNHLAIISFIQNALLCAIDVGGPLVWSDCSVPEDTNRVFPTRWEMKAHQPPGILWPSVLGLDSWCPWHQPGLAPARRCCEMPLRRWPNDCSA